MFAASVVRVAELLSAREQSTITPTPLVPFSFPSSPPRLCRRATRFVAAETASGGNNSRGGSGGKALRWSWLLRWCKRGNVGASSLVFLLKSSSEKEGGGAGGDAVFTRSSLEGFF